MKKEGSKRYHLGWKYKEEIKQLYLTNYSAMNQIWDIPESMEDERQEAHNTVDNMSDLNIEITELLNEDWEVWEVADLKVRSLQFAHSLESALIPLGQTVRPIIDRLN